MNANLRVFSVGSVGLLAALVVAIPAGADSVTIPKGTAVELRLEKGLSSRSEKVGNTFPVSVLRPVYVDGRLALPAGTKVQGRVEVMYTNGAGAKSGVLGVEFVKLLLPGRDPKGIDAELTSLRADDRRKLVEHAPKVTTTRKSDVLFIGEAQGEGKLAHTLVGLRNTDNDDIARDWAKSGLGPGEADVSKGALITMEFDEPITIDPLFPADRFPRTPEDRLIFTSADTVRRAQEALGSRKYYAGAPSGVLDEATRHAIVRFQLDNDQLATGDLDSGTLERLGLKAP